MCSHDLKWNICSSLDKRKTLVVGQASKLTLWGNLSRMMNQILLLGDNWHANNGKHLFFFLKKMSFVLILCNITFKISCWDFLQIVYFGWFLAWISPVLSCAILSCQWPYVLQHDEHGVRSHSSALALQPYWWVRKDNFFSWDKDKCKLQLLAVSMSCVLKRNLHDVARIRWYNPALKPYSGYFGLFGNSSHLYF